MKPEQLSEVAFKTLTALWERLAEIAPRLVAALLILFFGWLLARVLRAVVRKALTKLGLKKLSERVGARALLERIGINDGAVGLASQVVYWSLLLITMLSAADTLGLDQVSSTIDWIVAYLPNVVGAGLVIILGLAGVGLARTAVVSFLERLGSESAAIGGRLVYGLGVLVIGGLAIAQLQIETRLFELAVAIVLGAVGIAVGLSLGLGTKKHASNVLAGVYARDVYVPGERIDFQGRRGSVIEVGTMLTRVRLDDEAGELRIPNELLATQAIVAEPGPPS